MPRPAWIRTGSERSLASATIERTFGWSSVNCSARGWSLIPLAPLASERSASGTGSSCGLTRQNGTSSPSDVARRGEHVVVGGGVAVGLVERERERPARAGELERGHELLAGLLHPVRVVLAEVGVGVEQLEPRDLVEHHLGPGAQLVKQVHRWIRTMKPDVPVPHGSLAPRRRRDPQPRRARAAGRDRQLVRPPPGQAPRRRAGGVGDGLELRGALPQRAYLSRAAAHPPPGAPGLGAAVRQRSGRDGLGRRARGRRRRGPDRHQHGLPGAEGVQDRRRRGAARGAGARGGGGAGGGARERAAGDRQAALGPAPGRSERARGGPPARVRRRRVRDRHPSPPRLPAPQGRPELRAGARSWWRSCRCRCSCPAGCRRPRRCGARSSRPAPPACCWRAARSATRGCSSRCSGCGSRLEPGPRGGPGRARLGDRLRGRAPRRGPRRPATCGSSTPGTSSASAAAARSRGRSRPRRRSTRPGSCCTAVG